MESRILQLILDLAVNLNIPAVIIGGLALPAYNVARSTLDVNICIYIKNQQDLDKFIENLIRNEILTRQNPKANHDLFTVHGKFGEAEIWLKPCDAFNWDDDMVKKRKKFYANFYVLSVEDFILTKLARSDRTSVDIGDILQVIIANKNQIDWNYLYFRLKWNDIEKDFKNILESFELDYNNNLRNISKEILNKLKEIE